MEKKSVKNDNPNVDPAGKNEQRYILAKTSEEENR